MSEDAPLWQKVGLAVDSALHTLVAPEPEPPPEKTYRLGILFVHGMGQQERGDTITQMGDALTEWLRRWLGNDRFSLRDATLRGPEATAVRDDLAGGIGQSERDRRPDPAEG